VPSKHNGAPI